MIDKHKLKDEYIKFFDNLNKMNINYGSIFFYLQDINKINYLKEINVNFNKIKRLTLRNLTKKEFKEFEDIYDNDNDNDDTIQKENENFFETFFSFNNIKDNLIYLDIQFTNYKINTDLFENINKFKLLRYLYMENFYFHKMFIITLKELQILSVKFSINIIFYGNTN